MSGALNLIIARGFDSPIQGALNSYNNQRQAQESIESANINQQGARQSQQWQGEDRALEEQARQKAAQRAQEQESLLAMIPEIDARLRANPDDQEARAAAVEIHSRLNPKEATSGLQGLLYPEASSGSGFGNVNPGDYTPESLARYAQTGNYADLVRQYAPPGIAVVNSPGFGVGIVDKGNPGNRTMLTTPEQEAAARAESAAATAGAKEGAKSAAAAVSDLPRVKESSRQIRGLLDQLSNPDALKWVYGPASIAPVVPGTPQADAVGIWDQINGQAFMQAFTALKGGGQITEKEGEKATVAITRLSNRKISTKAAQAAINELRDITQRAEVNAEKRATKASPEPTSGGEINFADLPD